MKDKIEGINKYMYSVKKINRRGKKSRSSMIKFAAGSSAFINMGKIF